MDQDHEFGKRLKKALDHAGLSQLEAAKMLGLNKDSLTNYVKGRLPKAEILRELARVCSVSVDWLLTGNGPGPGEKQETEKDPGFAARLNEAMIAVGLTPQQAAAQLNLPRDALERYLTGELPGPRELLALARLTGVSMEWLIAGEGVGPGPAHGRAVHLPDIPVQTAPNGTAYISGSALKHALKKYLAELLAEEKDDQAAAREEIIIKRKEISSKPVDDEIEQQLYRVLPNLTPQERDKLYKYLEYILESRQSNKSSGSKAASGN